MRLSEYGFKPATLACLHNADIDAPWELDDHTCRELIWHSQIPATAVYDILSVLHQHGKTLKPNTRKNARPLTERNLAIFRLRVVDGRTLREVTKASWRRHRARPPNPRRTLRPARRTPGRQSPTPPEPHTQHDP